MTQQPLVIKDWQNGMADGPNLGLALIKNASIDTIPGALVPQYAPSQISAVATSTTFTADSSNDICTVASTIALLITGNAIQFTTTGTLPAGLSLNTDYYLIKVSPTTFKVATSYANSQVPTAIDITDAGSGVHTISTIDMGTPNSIADDINESLPLIYIADSNGRVWYKQNSELILLTGNTRTNGGGRGLAHFVNSDASGRYLFVFRNATIDICDVTTEAKRRDPVGTSAWTTAWQNLNSSSGSVNSHHSIVGQDNIIYFCDDRYVGSIVENAGSVFAPGTAATYTYNSQALKLPQGEIAWWLEELGVNLLTAGKTYNFVYPWDRSSPSFALPIVCAENGVYRLKNINNTVFIFNGVRGNIYKTQGAVVTIAKKLPEYITGSGITWGGVGNKGGAVLFGVGCLNTGEAGAAMSGIYALWPDGRLVLENQLTAGSVSVTVINRSGGEFYSFGGSGEFDTISTSRYTSFGAVAQSQMYAVGNKTQKAKFSQLEVQLNQPGGGSIRVSYRTRLNATFTVLATYIETTGVTSFATDIGLTDLENIQIQVELSDSGSGTGMTQLMEVRLIP